MPEIEVSRDTYHRILKDLRDRESDGSLAKYAGRWSDVTEDRIEDVKNTLSTSR